MDVHTQLHKHILGQSWAAVLSMLRLITIAKPMQRHTRAYPFAGCEGICTSNRLCACVKYRLSGACMVLSAEKCF